MRKAKFSAFLCIPVAAILAFSPIASGTKTAVDFTPADSSFLDISSCRYTQMEPDERKTPNLLEDLSGFELKMENDRLAVYFRQETNGIRILNKATGYVWGGVAADKAENLNRSWSAMANSLLTIDYLDDGMQSRRLSLGSEGVSVEYSWGEQAATGRAEFQDISISFSFTLSLSEESLTVSISRESIEEGGKYKLKSVWLLPFLGTVEQDAVTGYMFIPDGSGALIRYSPSAQYVSAYDERIYGKDVSVNEMSIAGDLLAKRNNDYLTDVPRITMPVYGAVHGAEKDAYLAVVDSGALYASVYASPAGYVTDYNWTGIRFDYRNVYSIPMNRSGKAIITTQDAPEDFDAAISFYFLEGEDADYTGMAKMYRRLLLEDGYLSGQEREDTDIPLYLKIMGGEVEESLIFNGYQRLTTVEDLRGIVSDLAESGISNLSVSYAGWLKGGLSGSRFGQTGLDGKLGSMNDLDSLQQEIMDRGGRLFLSVDPITFNQDQARAASLAALRITKTFSSFTRNNSALMYPTEYYARPSSVVEYIENLYGRYAGFGLEFQTIGNTVYGDYTRGASQTRAETMEMFLSLLSQRPEGTALSNPNLYLWNQTSEYLDTPVQNSQYIFETDSVPFLEIVLKGSVDYYAPFANQGFYTQDSILKMIEYGTYPSFILMAEENDQLIKTPLSDYFSLNYGDWKPVIQEVYNAVNQALRSVEGCSMENHQAIAEGVIAVEYSNGVTIYVNYTAADYTLETGGSVAAHSYLVREGE